MTDEKIGDGVPEDRLAAALRRAEKSRQKSRGHSARFGGIRRDTPEAQETNF